MLSSDKYFDTLLTAVTASRGLKSPWIFAAALIALPVHASPSAFCHGSCSYELLRC